jgi:hypothetical protein
MEGKALLFKVLRSDFPNQVSNSLVFPAPFAECWTCEPAESWTA